MNAAAEGAVCPSCRSRQVADAGALPPFTARIFGGHPIDRPLDAGRLIHCRFCDLHFRFPVRPQSEWTGLYEKLPEDVWHEEKVPHYWPTIRQLLARYADGRSVLDIGCFKGQFLRWLPAEWDKAGIEPSEVAARIAAAAGIRIAARSLESLDGTGRFGAITMMDVMEHLTEPFAALERARTSLNPKGCIVILTGSTDCWPWRLFRPSYWYSALPEHVSFFSLRWFRWAAARLKLRILFHRRISSEPQPWPQTLGQFARQGAYAAGRGMGPRRWLAWAVPLLPGIRRAAGWEQVPWFRAARDHWLIVMGPAERNA